MTPADFVHALAVVNERLRTARTAALSLMLFAGLALAGAYVVRAVEPGLAKTCAAIAVGGGLGAIVMGRVLQWRRVEIYDDILLAGFRHVGGPDVARRAAELMCHPRRCQLADTLERFVEVAWRNDPCAVPLHRQALRELAPRVRQMSMCLREPGIEVEAAGMVLVRRLVTDGAHSPLFAPISETRDLERALDRIHAELGWDAGASQVETGLRLAA
ncbi:MAG TPA: hypothetical protein VE777_13060 [Gaiellales bacterium]|jgi:hypothetical protein|nr:hypothetical protein [Gaiellales bacterium]